MLRANKLRRIEPPPPAAALLRQVQHVQQRRPDWCWAACTEMLLQVLPGHQTATQCQIVADVKGGNLGCCQADRIACVTSGTYEGHLCDGGMEEDEIDALFTAHGIGFVRVDDVLSPGALDTQIATAPVQVWLENENGAQHVALVVRKLANGFYEVADPCHSTSLSMVYDALLEHRGEWTRTWRDLR